MDTQSIDQTINVIDFQLLKRSVYFDTGNPPESTLQNDLQRHSNENLVWVI